MKRPAWRSLFAFLAICGLLAGCTAEPAVQPSAAPSVSETSATPAASAVPSASASPTVSSGSTTEVVPGSKMTTAAPIDLDQTSSAQPVKVSLVTLSQLVVEGRGPGEITGPAVAVTVRISNGTSKSLDLDHVIVNLLDAKKQLATPMTGDPADPFHGQLAAGADQSAVYVFSVATSALKPVQISVTYDVEEPTVLFKGNL